MSPIQKNRKTHQRNLQPERLKRRPQQPPEIQPRKADPEVKEQKTRYSKEHPKVAATNRRNKGSLPEEGTHKQQCQRGHTDGGGGNTRAGAILTFQENCGSLRVKLVVANLNGGTEEK